MAIGIGRRQFIGALGSTAAALPFGARAQQVSIPVIGFLNGESSTHYASFLDAFREGLREAGYIVGQNVKIEFRWADGQYERLPGLAKDLVQRQVAVIVANAPAVQSAKAATTNIPIVFIGGFDPVKSGLVASLNQPGGNVTGVAALGTQLGPKRLELMNVLLPQATHFAVLNNPSSFTAQAQLEELQVASRPRGLQLSVLNARSDSEFNGVFSTSLQWVLVGLSSPPTRTSTAEAINSQLCRSKTRCRRFISIESSLRPAGF